MEPKKQNYCLVGLPNSGKSSYVAALWHVVEAKEIADSLQVDTLPINRHYLEQLRENWISCSDLGRTSVENIPFISLQCKDAVSGNTAAFTFPDVKGELFKQLFESREITQEYQQFLKDANGILLFIGEKLQVPLLIADYEDVFPGEPSSKAQPWKHEDVPTQVILVDLLQIIAGWIKKPFKIGLIISAWDVHLKISGGAAALTPREWLKNKLPLLNQFIHTNTEKFSVECFGVSAQGGNYDAEKTDLLNFDLPSNRIKVQQQSATEISNDITIPIKWLLNRQ